LVDILSGSPASARRPRSAPVEAVLRPLFFAAVVGAVVFFLILPTLVVIPVSFGSASYIEFPPRGFTLKWYADYFRDPDWMAATWFSLKIAVSTTIAATVIGTLGSLAMVRGRLPGKEFVQVLALSPMVVPHIVMAVSIYLVFAPIGLTGNFFGFLVAHTMLSVPYVVITVSAVLQRFDATLELAAQNCGATRTQAFFWVVLPNILPGVAAGGVFAFLASFDEATVAFFISDVGGKTITRKMFEDIDFNLTPVIAAVSTVIMLISLVLMTGVQLLQSRKQR